MKPSTAGSQTTTLTAAVRLVLSLLAVVLVVVGLANFVVYIGTATSPFPVLLSHPLAILAAGYLLTQVILPWFMGNQSREEVAQREQLLRASGAALAATRTGGRIGGVYVSRGWLAVQVFPAGILLKPTLMRSSAVLNGEVTGLRVKQGLLGGGPYIEVTCSTSAVNSRVAMYVPPTSDVARAIEQITGMRFAVPSATTAAVGR
jgi:hypothetical protein